MNKTKVISNMIESLRKENNMTLEELSNKLDMKYTTLRNKELNKSQFTLDELLILSNIFDFNIYISNELINEVGQFRKIIIETRGKKEINQDLVRIYSGMATLASYSNKEKGKAKFKMNEVFSMCEFLDIPFKIKYKNNVKKIDLEGQHIKSELKQVICLESGKIYDTTNAVSKVIGTSRQYIWALCQKGGGKDSEGNTWMYLEDYFKKLNNNEEKEIEF